MFSIQYSRVEFFGGGRELLGSPNLLSIRPKRGPNRAGLVEASSTGCCAFPKSEAEQFRTLLAEHDGFQEQMEGQARVEE